MKTEATKAVTALAKPAVVMATWQQKWWHVVVWSTSAAMAVMMAAEVVMSVATMTTDIVSVPLIMVEGTVTVGLTMVTESNSSNGDDGGRNE